RRHRTDGRAGLMRGAVIAAILAVAASPAVAQDAGDDWDLTVDEAHNMMLATVGYSSGQAIAVRCREGDLDVLISGLPPMEGAGRRIETAYADGRVESGLWLAAGNGALIFSPAPRLDARRLRQGGPLQLSVALESPPAGPLRRFALDLPARSVNLDQVLEACGEGRPDPRDDLIRWTQPDGMTDLWRRQPAPMYPEAAVHLGAGFATFSCVVAEGGRLTDCRTERESHARRYGFGESAMRSLRDARVAPADEGGPPVGMLLLGTIRFRIAS
ncbi:MAG: energy transducer TonB, partial [Brevundimonas sp.]|nr:energy transducer TonB [Brevundimonas sp.]